jgi:hypothetical protein
VSASKQSSAAILPFVRPVRAANRMTARDRIAALEWHAEAASHGYTRVAFDNSAGDNEPELGDFMLIYTQAASWARWGVGCCDGGYIVWRPADGATLSWHPTIRRALASIPPAASASDH